MLTEAFAVGWPNAPHRVLGSALQAAQAFQGEVVGVLHAGPKSEPLPRLAAPHTQPGGHRHGRGHGPVCQGVGLVTHITPAAQVVTELAQGAAQLLRR